MDLEERRKIIEEMEKSPTQLNVWADTNKD